MLAIFKTGLHCFQNGLHSFTCLNSGQLGIRCMYLVDEVRFGDGHLGCFPVIEWNKFFTTILPTNFNLPLITTGLDQTIFLRSNNRIVLKYFLFLQHLIPSHIHVFFLIERLLLCSHIGQSSLVQVRKRQSARSSIKRALEFSGHFS